MPCLDDAASKEDARQASCGGRSRAATELLVELATTRCVQRTKPRPVDLVSRDQQCRARGAFVTFGRIQSVTHGLDDRPGHVRDGPNRTLVHAKRIRAIILTVCGDLLQRVLGRVRAPWRATQLHRPEQSPRQLQLTLSIHGLAIVRHSDERQSRKAARQDSTSGTRREWRPCTAASWASRTIAKWRSRRNLPRATGAEAAHATFRLCAVAVCGPDQAALAVPDVACFVRPLLGFESATDYSEHMGFRESVLAPHPRSIGRRSTRRIDRVRPTSAPVRVVGVGRRRLFNVPTRCVRSGTCHDRRTRPCRLACSQKCRSSTAFNVLY